MVEEKDLYFKMEKMKREPNYKNKLNFYNVLKKIALYVPFVCVDGNTREKKSWENLTRQTLTQRFVRYFVLH